MKFKKIIATVLTSVMALGIFVAPVSGLQAEAAPDWSTNWNDVRVYTANYSKSIPSINMQTPQTTVKLYAGMSWERLEENIGVRLNVSDSECGPQAMNGFHTLAAAMGATVVKVLDMDMELYTKEGWTEDVVTMTSPIRVGMTLPKGCDLTKDYAVISVRENGSMEVLGDLDPEPTTLTVDSASFDTFAIIAAPAGTFNAFRVASPHALDQLWVSNYTKDIISTVSAESKGYRMYDIGTVSDVAAVRAAVGDQIVSLEVSSFEPGPDSMSLLRYAAWKAGARRASYYEIELKNGKGQRVTETRQKIRVMMTLPFDFPAYADYAVAVLNADGTVSILKDIDTNDSTITIDTDQFRSYAIMWAPKGTFALIP